MSDQQTSRIHHLAPGDPFLGAPAWAADLSSRLAALEDLAQRRIAQAGRESARLDNVQGAVANIEAAVELVAGLQTVVAGMSDTLATQIEGLVAAEERLEDIEHRIQVASVVFAPRRGCA